MSPRMTRADRERRKARARKIKARTEFLDNLQDTVLAYCGDCGQRLGWWSNEGSSEWSTKPGQMLDPSDPGAEFHFSYRGYPDTGYEVEVDRWDWEAVRGGPFGEYSVRLIRSTGGMRARNGERIGRRPRTNDLYLNAAPYGNPDSMVGQIVVLPADVFCPACKKDILNSIPPPPADEPAV